MEVAVEGTDEGLPQKFPHMKVAVVSADAGLPPSVPPVEAVVVGVEGTGTNTGAPGLKSE